MINMVVNADKSALKTFIGMVFIKLGTGIITLWGSFNIYFFSYLRNEGFQINPNTNSLMMLGAMIPSTISALFSTRFTAAYGYQSVIRVCSIIFTISPLILNIVMNKFVVALFYLYIPVTCFAISSIPVLNCIWSQFHKDLNKISGAAILFFSLGTIIWNIIFTAIINPNNQAAIIDDMKQPYFKQEITHNLLKAINITCISSGMCFFIGSFLVQKKKSNNIELAEQSPPHNVENIIQNNKQKQKLEIQQLVGSQSSQLGQNSKEGKDQMLVSKCIMDKRFIILCCISFMVPLYMIYLVLNMKILFMPIINDDHFLAFCSILVTISAVGGTFWGKIADHYGFKLTLIMIIALDIVCKILGIFCTQKWNLAFLYFMLGFNDKGVLTLIGPGLIEMFGLQMATELIPYKGIFLILSYITVPLLHLVFNGILSYRTLLGIFIMASFVALYLSYYFYTFIKYKSFKSRAGEKVMIIQNNKSQQC